MKKSDQLHGALELLILKSVSRKANHGFGITLHIQSVSEGLLRVEEGSLYPALQRMLLKGSVQGDWGRTEENRRARYYRITAVGRRELEREMAAYRRVTGAIDRILQPA